MRVDLPWGSSFLSLDLPETWDVHLPKRPETPDGKAPDEAEIVRAVLQRPIGSKRLSQLDLRGKKILIIVDDNTRPTPTNRFFHLIREELAAGGATLDNVTVLTALGIHTPMTETEMAEKIGRDNVNAVSWENHDAFDPERNHDFGRTGRGTPVIVNKKVFESSLVILVGMIEPHLWAGFGGGLKNLFPGVAAADAIGHHHSMISEPPYWFNRVGADPEENLFRKDIEEMRTLIPADMFIINVLLDENRRIMAAYAGDPILAHREGIKYNQKKAGIPLAGQVDAVIVNSQPMNFNFKQSMKCVGNALPALKPGGIVMAFLKAERGLDDIPLPDKPPPLFLLKAILRTIGRSRVMGFLNIVKKGLNIEEKFLTYYSMRLISDFDLYCYVPVLSENEIRHLGFFRNCGSPQEVIDTAGRRLPQNARVAVFPEGGATFPIVE
jgi:lactate racemase